VAHGFRTGSSQSASLWLLSVPALIARLGSNQMAGKHSVASSHAYSGIPSHAQSPTGSTAAGTQLAARHRAEPRRAGRATRAGLIAAGGAGALGTASVLVMLVPGLALSPWPLGSGNSHAEEKGDSGSALVEVVDMPYPPAALAETPETLTGLSSVAGTPADGLAWLVGGRPGAVDGTGSGGRALASGSRSDTVATGRSDTHAGSPGPSGSRPSTPRGGASTGASLPRSPVGGPDPVSGPETGAGGTVTDVVDEVAGSTGGLVGGATGAAEGLTGGLGGGLAGLGG